MTLRLTLATAALLGCFALPAQGAPLRQAQDKPPAVSAAEPPPLGLTTEGVAINVVDGDTLDVEVRYRVRVRLIDVWAPEKGEPGGALSTRSMTRLALAKPCVLWIPADGARSAADLFTFGRVLGHVYVDGKSIGAAQVRSGHASSTKGGRLGE